MDPPIRLDHVVVEVSDHARADEFYAQVLGAELIERTGGRFHYRIGGQQLNVHGPGGDPRPVAARPGGPGSADICFEWEGPIADAREHLERRGVPVELGPVERWGAGGRGASVYFRDPDGNLIEFISYAAGPRA